MRILLCDDEPMVRLGLKSKLMELYPGAHSFLEAVNGRELLAQAEELPDLAFVDIKMPLMDGLTAIEQAKAISPDTIWLLLSGYSEFEYAQTALRLGITDYLVKPIGTDELAAVMQTVDRHRAKQAAVRRQMFRMEMLDLFYDSRPMREQNTAPGRAGAVYSICIVFGEGHLAGPAPDQEMETLLEHNAAEAGGRYTLFFLPTGERCLVMENAQAPVSQALKGLEGLEEFCTGIWEQGLRSRQALPAVGEDILAVSGLRIVRELSGLFHLGELQQLPDRERLLQAAQLVDKLCLAYLDGNEVLYRNTLADWQALPFSLMQQVQTAAVARYIRAVTHADLKGQTAKTLLQELEALGETIHRQDGKAGATGLIAQIVDYVQQHYMQDIGVGTIADSLGITPSYLSRIFHKQTGEKFIDYLSAVRIAAAKRLLSRFPDRTVKEVAEQVGYQNSRHFARVFFKLEGVNPSDYQKDADQRRQNSRKESE